MVTLMKTLKPAEAAAEELWNGTLLELSQHMCRLIKSAPGDEAVKVILAYRACSYSFGVLAAAMEVHAGAAGLEEGWRQEVKDILTGLIDRGISTVGGRKLSS